MPYYNYSLNVLREKFCNSWLIYNTSAQKSWIHENFHLEIFRLDSVLLSFYFYDTDSAFCVYSLAPGKVDISVKMYCTFTAPCNFQNHYLSLCTVQAEVLRFWPILGKWNLNNWFYNYYWWKSLHLEIAKSLKDLMIKNS